MRKTIQRKELILSNTRLLGGKCLSDGQQADEVDAKFSLSDALERLP